MHQSWSGTLTPARRPRRIAMAAGLVALALVAAACGSARSEDELLAAVRASHEGTGFAADADRPSSEQTPTESADGPPAPTSGAADSGSLPNQGADAADATPTPQGPSSGETDVDGTGRPDSRGGPTCTGDEEPLTIASVGQQSGVFGPFMQPITHGVQTWASAMNARGGVACHQIRYVVRDDGGDPSVHQSEVQRLVESENVIALVGTTAVLSGQASVRYLTNNGVPVVGSEGGSDWFYKSPVFFPHVASGDTALGSMVGAIGKVGTPQDKTTLAVVTCLEAALCSSLYEDAPRLAGKAGLDLVYRTQTSLTTLDFTSVCQNARRADLLIIGLDTNSIKRVLRNCQSVGYRPIAMVGGPLVTPDLLEDSRAEGLYLFSATELYTNEAQPAVAEYRQAMASYSPGTSPSLGSLVGWTAGELFRIGLENAPEATRAGLLEGLYSIRDNNLNGLTHPLTFTAGQPAPRVGCVWIAQIQGGTLVPAAGAPQGLSCD